MKLHIPIICEEADIAYIYILAKEVVDILLMPFLILCFV